MNGPSQVAVTKGKKIVRIEREVRRFHRWRENGEHYIEEHKKGRKKLER